MEIIPSILTESAEEVIKRLASLRGLGLSPQLDFMDGQFVPSQSIAPDDLPPDIQEFQWEAHLMVQEPLVWSQPLYAKQCRRIYWHVEVLPLDVTIPHHLAHVDHGIALRLETPVSVIEPFVPMIQSVLLLSIKEPGFQGRQFQVSVYPMRRMRANVL